MLQLNVPFVVRDIMSDFEYGAIGAARAVLGANVNLHGCFFITANPPRDVPSLDIHAAHRNNRKGDVIVTFTNRKWAERWPIP